MLEFIGVGRNFEGYWTVEVYENGVFMAFYDVFQLESMWEIYTYEKFGWWENFGHRIIRFLNA